MANDLGLRSYPTVRMKDIDMRDESQLMKVATRLMELGILTPQQGMEMFHNGRFPEADKIGPAQESFVQERQEGFYNPLVGGVPMAAPTAPTKPDSQPVNKTPRQAGRPEGSTGIPIADAKYSRADIQATIYEIDAFVSTAEKKMLKKLKAKKLNDSQGEMLNNLCESIVCAQDKEYWVKTLESCVKDFNKIEKLQTLEKVLSISGDHNLEAYPAAILYHSHERKS